MKSLIALLMLVLAGLAQAAPASAPQDEAAIELRLKTLSQDLRCLVCQNETLADSQAQLAINLRREVREQISSGKNDEQVIHFLTERYGDFVLYDPPFKPYTWLLWFGPFLLLGLGGWIWWRLVRPATTTPDTGLNDEEARQVAALIARSQQKDRS